MYSSLAVMVFMALRLYPRVWACPAMPTALPFWYYESQLIIIYCSCPGQILPFSYLLRETQENLPFQLHSMQHQSFIWNWHIWKIFKMYVIHLANVSWNLKLFCAFNCWLLGYLACRRFYPATRFVLVSPWPF